MYNKSIYAFIITHFPQFVNHTIDISHFILKMKKAIDNSSEKWYNEFEII